jgi:hypothetical protein
MASSTDNADDSVDELHSLQASSPTKSAGVPSVTTLQHRPRASGPIDTNVETEEGAGSESTAEDSTDDDRDELSFEIHVPAPINREEYTWVSSEPDDNIVESVQSEVEGAENVHYHIVYADGRDEIVSSLHSIFIQHHLGMP